MPQKTGPPKAAAGGVVVPGVFSDDSVPPLPEAPSGGFVDTNDLGNPCFGGRPVSPPPRRFGPSDPVVVTQPPMDQEYHTSVAQPDPPTVFTNAPSAGADDNGGWVTPTAAGQHPTAFTSSAAEQTPSDEVGGYLAAMEAAASGAAASGPSRKMLGDEDSRTEHSPGAPRGAVRSNAVEEGSRRAVGYLEAMEQAHHGKPPTKSGKYLDTANPGPEMYAGMSVPSDMSPEGAPLGSPPQLR
jgi:hypothetical protein